jgi:4-hydroxy-tetrahydrodipicolinate reductase
MGNLVATELLQQQNIQLIAGVECPGHYTVGSTIGDAPVIADGDKIPAADVWIDFSVPGSALEHIRLASGLGLPIVVAVTGFTAENIADIKTYAERCAILMAPNLSVGIGVMDSIIGETRELLGEDFDPVIFEIHHAAKRDAPSGTALRLSEQLSREGREIPIASLRAGGVIGEHQVRFAGQSEELIITHRAWSRQAFSQGVPRAIRFITRQEPGLYSIRDMYKAS